MLRLLISLLVAGLIAGGVYYFLILDSGEGNTPGATQDASEVIDSANNAVQQSQNLQEQVNQRAEQAEGY